LGPRGRILQPGPERPKYYSVLLLQAFINLSRQAPLTLRKHTLDCACAACLVAAWV
jgi:hypothetical protein